MRREPTPTSTGGECSPITPVPTDSSACSTRPRRRPAGRSLRPPAFTAASRSTRSTAPSNCAVIEVALGARRALRVERVVCAIDCGHVVNPMTVEMQVESATVYALTAALYGEITIKDGRVEQSNFHDYRMLRLAQMPKVETVIVPGGGFWGGVGEPPVAVVAPALCNAIFAATGKRVRSLPLKNHDDLRIM